MDLFETLQQKHIELIELTERSDLSDDQRFAKVETFIGELKEAGALIADSKQRNQLRTLLRYWGSHLYEQKGEFPDTQLLPLNPAVERKVRLEQLYNKARRLFGLEQWAEAISLCQQIIEESPDYKDAQDLLREAKRELKAGELVSVQQPSPPLAKPFTQYLWPALGAVGLIIILLIGGILIWPNGWRDWIAPPTPAAVAPPPTSTAVVSSSLTPTSTVTPVFTPTPTPGEMAGMLTADLNVYQGPGENYRIVGSLKRLTEVMVTGRNQTGDWWQIAAADLAGWVRSEFIEVAATPFLPVVTAQPPPTITPTATDIPTPLNLLPIEPASLNKIEPVATLFAHEGPVLQVAFSPDGKLLASSGGDETVRIWSIPNTQLMATLSDQIGWVQTGVFSPDGLWLASGGSDRIVRLWDVARRQIFAEFYGHNGFVFSNAFQPDSSLMASSSGDGTVRLWDIGSGTQAAILEGGITDGGISAVYEVAFNPAGTELASGSIDGFVRIWDIATFDKVCEFGTASVLSVAYNPDGNSLASGNTRGQVILLSARCQPQRVLEGHTDNVNSVAYSPDGRLLASGSRDKLVKVWPLPPTTAEPVTLSEHLASVETITFSPDGLLLVSGSADGNIIFWGVMGN